MLIKTGSNVNVWVVDPSNFLFSSHLANDDFNKELESDGLPKIETIHKKIQVYKTGSDTGYEANKYRDCTDIAVKLAFGFNSVPIVKFDKDIIKHSVVVRVSNNAEIDKSIIESQMVARVKQTSSLKAQKDYEKAQSVIDQKVKMTSTNTSLNTKIKDEYKKIVDSNLSPTIVLDDLVKLNKSLNDELTNLLDDSHSDLVGVHNDYLTE